MSRLPIPGSDQGTWGGVLNDFLGQAHATDGTLKTASVGAPQLKTNSVTAAALAPDSVTTTAMAPSSVTSTELANNSVTAAIIADGTITEAQLDPTTQTSLTKATTSVQSVNGKTPISGLVTLAPADVSAEPAGLSLATKASLNATYVSFRDATTGLALTGKHVIITVDPTTNSIQDIITEAIA